MFPLSQLLPYVDRTFAVWLSQGDSATAIPKIIQDCDHPPISWLDAHYSSADTARTAVDTPIIAALEQIFRWHSRPRRTAHRRRTLFLGTKGYPTLVELRAYVDKCRPRYGVELADDIIRLTSGSSA